MKLKKQIITNPIFQTNMKSKIFFITTLLLLLISSMFTQVAAQELEEVTFDVTFSGYRPGHSILFLTNLVFQADGSLNFPRESGDCEQVGRWFYLDHDEYKFYAHFLNTSSCPLGASFVMVGNFLFDFFAFEAVGYINVKREINEFEFHCEVDGEDVSD